MKTKLLFIFACGMTMLSSCGDIEDKDVYVSKSLVPDFQYLIDSMDVASNFPTTLSTDEETHPEYKFTNPEDSTEQFYVGQHGWLGYYGYVDLGLSVKWGTSNIGVVMRRDDGPLVNYDEIYESKIKDIKPVSKPDLKTVDIQYPATMPYDEYRKYMDYETFEEQCDDYLSYCAKMEYAHKTSVDIYNSKNSDQHSYLYYEGDEIYWGYTSGSSSDSPMNIAGDKNEDDVTRKLGGKWRMPTRAEWQELIDRCTWEKHDGETPYYIVTGPSGKKIFLPIFKYKDYLTSERSDEPNDEPSMYGRDKRKVYTVDIRQRVIRTSDPFKNYIRPVYSK